MSRRKRPTALDVSFADDPSSSLFQNNAKKRKSEAEQLDIEFSLDASERDNVLPQVDLSRHHVDDSALDETPRLVIPGESAEDEITKRLITSVGSLNSAKDEETKPVRVLDHFSIYDPKDRNKYISLSALEEQDGIERHFEAQGSVSAFMNEEDAGQEDDLGFDPSVFVSLSSIWSCTLNFQEINDPFYIETQYAFYRLGMPSDRYLPFYRDFYISRRAAQIVISTLIDKTEPIFSDLLDECSYMDQSILGRNLEPRDFVNAYQFIKAEIKRPEPKYKISLKAQLMKDIGDGNLPNIAKHHRRRRQNLAKAGLNLDTAVLQAGNQNQTAVTPLVDQLAFGLFHDLPYVVDFKKDRRKQDLPQGQLDKERRWLEQLMERFANGPEKVFMDNRYRLRGARDYLEQVGVGGEQVKVGDVVIVPMDDLDARLNKVMSENDLSGFLADYCWFARIISIQMETRKAHIQWFEHSSQTLMDEISHPRELFVNQLCDNYPLREILGKVSVRSLQKGEEFTYSTDSFEYFYKFQYIDGKFVDIPRSVIHITPPDNCPVCPVAAQHDIDSHPQFILNGSAWSYHGQKYHVHDFVNFVATAGPCQAGQIVSFEQGGRRDDEPIAVVNLLGRMDSVQRNRPRDYVKDERHLFLTEDVDKIPIKDLIRKIYVVLPTGVTNLEIWKAMSPAHFYIRYGFSSIKAESWMDVVEIENAPICEECFSQNHKDLCASDDFFKTLEKSPLRALDLFAGVGAFGLGMEASCPIKVTHAIEISPSAAHTLKNNSPSTIVYNQCANEMLCYAVDTINGVDDVTTSLEGDILPSPPQPGDIDILIAGFPCQTHSSLNMYRRANDRKSHLILNLLSWVDFLQPRFCFFENVRGFLTYNLNSAQKDKHRPEGGIPMGGLKFVVSTLVAMDYQVEFSLLQAGHYGAPQTRIRFFLIAAKRGEVLPEFPQPTHDFPVIDALKIKVKGKDLKPIHTLTGTAPGRYVTIDDAIGDLPLFDWKGTKTLSVPGWVPVPHREVVTLKPDRSKGRCGFEGPSVEYRSEPKTAFQLRCRRKPTTDLQHITRTLLEGTVDRVVHIPLRARADYRDLPSGLWEWQISNQRSAVARGGFKAGFYGRLGKDEHFFTTVTNVEPTAKQCWVLHPECKRVITVRELARSQGFPDSFVFHSITGDVKTMHRQIGNAVAWPVSVAIGRELKAALYKGWCEPRDEKEDENMDEIYDLSLEVEEVIEISSD